MSFKIFLSRSRRISDALRKTNPKAARDYMSTVHQRWLLSSGASRTRGY